MSLRSEIIMVTCKQLTVLWCRIICISNAVTEGYWVRSSTYEICVWIKMELISPDYRSQCITVSQSSKILVRIILVICYKIWKRLKYNVDDSFRIDSLTLGHPEHSESKGWIIRQPYFNILECCFANIRLIQMSKTIVRW